MDRGHRLNNVEGSKRCPKRVGYSVNLNHRDSCNFDNFTFRIGSGGTASAPAALEAYGGTRRLKGSTVTEALACVVISDSKISMSLILFCRPRRRVRRYNQEMMPRTGIIAPMIPTMRITVLFTENFFEKLADPEVAEVAFGGDREFVLVGLEGVS